MIEHGEEPAPRREAALKNVGDPAEGDHRPAEHHEITVECDELAERDASGDHRAAAGPEHEQRSEAEKQRHARIERALQPDEHAVATEVLFVRPAEPFDLVGLLPVGAHDADARERFLDDGADVGELRLDALEPLVDRRPEVAHRERDERQRDEREQREPHVERQHQPDGHDEDEHGVGGVHDGRPDHHAHGVQVVGGARHQLARPPRLVVGERLPFELREDVVPDVEFDVARRADDDPAYQEQKHPAHERHAEEQHRVEAESASLDAVGQMRRWANFRIHGDRSWNAVVKRTQTIPSRNALAENVRQEPADDGRQHLLTEYQAPAVTGC